MTIVRVAQGSYDAKEDPDYRMVYSSQNKVLPIVKQGRFTFPPGGARETIYKHNLGFIPMFLIHNYTTSETRLQFANDDLSGVRVTDKEMYTTSNFSITSIVYTIFDIDLSKEYTSPVTYTGTTPAAAARPEDLILQLPAERRDISRNLQDFTITTEARNPMIHMVRQFEDAITIDHGLGYAPIVLVYGPPLSGDEGSFQFLYLGPESGLAVNIKSTAKDVQIAGAGTSGKQTAVILADPMVLV